ncbi:hypothetical protein REPUB_Repub03eG0224400 [Reevesia pubescens]
MFAMFKRINVKEHVVGWYSTGPKLKEDDLDIHELFNDYVPNPVLVIIDVQPKELGIPTKAYCAVEEVKENATQKSQKVFVHVPSEIAAHEVEEIGVEHLLRDVKDTTISTLTEVTGKLTALKGCIIKEHVVGWYSTGPKLKEDDLDIHELFNDYVPNPVLVIIDVQPKELGIPTKAYCAVEEVKENATQKSQKVFVHVPSEIAAHEVEEIGVEHLLRDVKDTTISTLTEVTGKLTALKGCIIKEHVVGWYSTGPKLKEDDLDIHELFNDYVPNPVLVIIDVQPKELGIPTKAYCAVEEVKENATQKSQKVFVHVPSEIAAHEVEEIGVEHLLRDVKDTTISTLTEVTGKLTALKGLDARLQEIRSYLDLVIEEKLPLNHEILYHLQDVFNLLPNLNVRELIKAFAVKTNDMMLVIYLSSLIRSVIALHCLINNKILNKEHEKAEDSKPVSVSAAAGS